MASCANVRTLFQRSALLVFVLLAAGCMEASPPSANSPQESVSERVVETTAQSLSSQTPIPQVSAATPTPTGLAPTGYPADFVGVIPLGAYKQDTGDGWASLQSEFILANQDTINWHDYRFQGSATIETAEGYSYEPTGRLSTMMAIPPGFAVLGEECAGVVDRQTNYIEAKVASNSSDYQLLLSEATIDGEPVSIALRLSLEQTETVTLPRYNTDVELPIWSIGDVVELPEAELRLTGASRSGDLMTISYEFTNLSGGYETELYASSHLIGDDGLLRRSTTDCGGMMDSRTMEFTLKAGPAQTTSGERIVFVPESVQSLYLLASVKTDVFADPCCYLVYDLAATSSEYSDDLYTGAMAALDRGEKLEAIRRLRRLVASDPGYGDAETRLQTLRNELGTIVFADSRSGVWNVEADGGDLKQILDESYSCTYPAVSPNRTAIACTNGSEVKLIQLPSLEEQQLLTSRDTPFPNEHFRSVSWSPDGTLVAVAAQRAGVYLVDVANGDFRRPECTQEFNSRDATWSANGDTILIHNDSQTYTKMTEGYYAYHITSDSCEMLVDISDSYPTRPSAALSPDAGQLAYHDGQRLFVMDLTSRDVLRLEEFSANCDLNSVRWSPDGEWIVYGVDCLGSDRILITPASGGETIEVVGSGPGSPGGARYPDWVR